MGGRFPARFFSRLVCELCFHFLLLALILFSQGHPNSESPCPADNCIDPAAVLFGFLALGGVMDREQEVVSAESADEVVVELSLDLLDMVAGASMGCALV